MARIRQIKPEFFLDDHLAGCCCRDARLLFIGLWNLSDREGRLEDRPAKIKAQIFPYDDDLTLPVIVSLINELCSESCLVRYEAAGKHLLWIPNFTLHQHFHRDEQASKLPEPSQDIKIHRASTVQAPLLHRTCTPTSTSTSGYRVSGVADAQGGAPQRAPTKRRTSQKTGAPDMFDVSDTLREWASRECPNADLKAETDKFLDYHRAKGNAFRDWDAAWRTWLRNSVKYNGNRNSLFNYHKETQTERTQRLMQEIDAEAANGK